MSGTLYALYLSRAARANLEIGIREGRWGLTQDAVSRLLSHLDPPRTGLDLLKELRAGDHIVAASGGPNSRVRRGGWADARLAEGFLWRVTAPYYYDTSEPWPAPPNKPDETYPHRFGIELAEAFGPIDKARVELAGMDALHYSANVGGLPMPIAPATPVLFTLPPVAAGQSEDPAFGVLGGELDGIALVSVRREQRRLRATRLGTSLTAACDLCERNLPVDCIRIAHIKRRAEATDQERRDPSNIMLACSLGCDHLFELGYIYVNEAGIIRSAKSRASWPDAQKAAVDSLVGKSCSAHTSASSTYFAWHAATIAP